MFSLQELALAKRLLGLWLEEDDIGSNSICIVGPALKIFIVRRQLVVFAGDIAINEVKA